jgi:methanogenic corrinoid protein MtbC1
LREALMGQEGGSIDAQAFLRMTELFAMKRSTLAPAAVQTLASDIVDRLARAAERAPRFEDIVLDEASITAFCAALIAPEAGAALRFIEARRAEGVTRQGVYLGYISAAARRLGEGWDRNEFSFAEVTIGTGHLYALMRALRAEEPTRGPAFDTRRCALFATVPGEDHSIGITVAADLFRDAGWEIDLRIAMDHDGLIAHVERTRPPIIGLSLSTERRLEDLIRLVVALRIAMPHVLIGVAPAAPLDAEKVGSLVDIDLLFPDVPTACADLDRLIRLRG